MDTKTMNSNESKESCERIEEDYENIKNDFSIFATDDEKLKFIGEILSNSSSRTILTLLIENDMTVMQVTTKTGLQPTLVIYHINKMIRADIVAITKNAINSRGHQMKYYRAKPAIMIFAKNSVEYAKKSKSLFKVIKKVTRFASIGAAGMITWMITSQNIDTAEKFPRPTLPPYLTPIENLGYSGDLVFSVTISLSVVIVGLVIDRILSTFRK